MASTSIDKPAHEVWLVPLSIIVTVAVSSAPVPLLRTSEYWKPLPSASDTLNHEAKHPGTNADVARS